MLQVRQSLLFMLQPMMISSTQNRLPATRREGRSGTVQQTTIAIYSGTGSYTPPDWQHFVANTTPEYHTYTIILSEPILIGVTDFNTTETLNWTDTNLVVTGFGFEATQSTGKVEFWDDITGTTKTTQTIDTWADTSIQIDAVQGSLPNDTVIYLVVTNDTGDVSAPIAVGVGVLPYHLVVDGLSPDHYWQFDGDDVDAGVTGPQRDFDTAVVGSPTYPSTPICEESTQALFFNGVTEAMESLQSPNMNITISSKERTLSMWIQLGSVQKSLSALWKEITCKPTLILT